MRIGVTVLGISLGLLAVVLGNVPTAAEEPKQEWGTIKGQVVWGEKDLPEVVKLNVDKDQEVCKKKGEVVSEEYIVDPKTKGVKNAFVWLMDLKDPKKGKLPLHPSLAKSKEASVVLDQPCCAFEPHVLAVRDDQTLVVKNSASVAHNVHMLGGLDFNQLIPAGQSIDIKDLKGAGTIVNVQCDIHGWMKAKILIFSHPYYTVTGADGKFEIKNVPAGKYRLAIWQEGMGWVAFDDPDTPKLGKVIEIKPDGQVKGDGVTDLGEFKVMKSKD
jgi:hypothetical protein